jgi:glycosyltransferase involved in cell wall biosynthesis
MEEIAGLYPDVLFVMKSKETSRLPNLLSVPYFEYYGNALEQCDFAVIPFSSDYKVSGPVFEALAMGKPVLVLKNKFGRYVKSLFSRPIFFAGEQIPTDTTAVNFTQFNHEIIRLCGKYLSQYAGGQETPVHHTTV